MDNQTMQSTSEREAQVNKIIEAEWDMFQKVDNIGGRAPCQEDWETFYAMRYSQTEIMDGATLDSYQRDLEEARLAGRNLLTEKYARMMKVTAPAYYEKELRAHLPELDPSAEQLAVEIADRMVNAERIFAEEYPTFSKAGRALEDTGDGEASIHTYALGELQTYSKRTLTLLLHSIQTLEEKGENIAYMIHGRTALFFGYDSVEDAEERAW